MLKKKNHTQRYKTKKNSINAYLWRAVINSDNIYLRFSLLNYAVSIQFMTKALMFLFI